jgi:hypothetical protein
MGALEVGRTEVRVNGASIVIVALLLSGLPELSTAQGRDPDPAVTVDGRRYGPSDCDAEKRLLVRQYKHPSGLNELVRTLQRIDAVDRLIGWWEHCPEDLRSEPPVVPGIEVLRSEAHRLRKRMAELEWSISF